VDPTIWPLKHIWILRRDRRSKREKRNRNTW